MSSPVAFEKSHLIRFHHCDPACIVFYPEYLVIFDELIEDWFNEGLHVDFAQLHAEQRIGIPAVRIEVDFIAPSKIGDSLCLRLVVKHLGTKSFTLMIEGSVGGEVRIRAVMVRVVAAIDRLHGVPIPDSLREKLARYLVEEAGK